MGLTYREAFGLFYSWRPHDRDYGEYCWPSDFAQSFRDADNSLAKAQVVAGLLIKIATEGGACLHQEGD